MPNLRDVMNAVANDRPLQLGIAALAAMCVYSISSSTEPSLSSPELNGNMVPEHLMQNLGGRDPLIIHLPAPEDAAARAAAAQINGRVVLVRDEAGDWYRMDPVADPDGRVDELSEALGKMSDFVCDKSREELAGMGLPEMTTDQRRMICEILPEEARP